MSNYRLHRISKTIYDLHFQKYVIKILQSVCSSVQIIYKSIVLNKKVNSIDKQSNRFAAVTSLCIKGATRICDKNIDGWEMITFCN